MNALCLLHVRNFKFFHFWLIIKLFLFYHVQIFFPFHCTFFLNFIKHIKVIWCQGKWIWTTWGNKLMEFGSHHHTCLLQLQVLLKKILFFCLFFRYQDISSFISPSCYLYLNSFLARFYFELWLVFFQLNFSLNFH